MTLEVWLQPISKSLPLFATVVEMENGQQTSGWTNWDEFGWEVEGLHMLSSLSAFQWLHLLFSSETLHIFIPFTDPRDCRHSSLMQYECISPACYENGRFEYLCGLGSLNSDAVVWIESFSSCCFHEYVCMCVNVRTSQPHEKRPSEDVGTDFNPWTTAVGQWDFSPTMRWRCFILS